ncbi:MAG: hypothetical protein KDC44_01415 [Phaeodactylibacter sp.]|nr:hypothetical protein [Phaeodactylibacter sp.]
MLGKKMQALFLLYLLGSVGACDFCNEDYYFIYRVDGVVVNVYNDPIIEETEVLELQMDLSADLVHSYTAQLSDFSLMQSAYACSPGEYYFLASHIANIEIRSQSDFNTDHPAGSVLNDLFSVSYTVLSNLEDKVATISTFISDCKPPEQPWENDLFNVDLIAARLTLAARPELSQTHILEFKVLLEDGRVLSTQTVEIQWL